MMRVSPVPLFVASILIAMGVAAATGCTQRNRSGNLPLPSLPSEDVSHLLVKPEAAAGEFDFDAPRDYLPDPSIDWVVTVRFEQPVSRERVLRFLDVDWLEGHKRPTIYGFSLGEKHWTYVSATDSPDSLSTLKVAWTLWNAIDEKPTEISWDDLGRLREAVVERLSALERFDIEIDRNGEESLALVRTLAKIVEKLKEVGLPPGEHSTCRVF